MNNTKYRIARVAKAAVWIPRDVSLLLLLLLRMEIAVHKHKLWVWPRLWFDTRTHP